MLNNFKTQQGFEGERIINVPYQLSKACISDSLGIQQLRITHIGYFPHAKFHYCFRRGGCPDNILIYCIRGRGWCRHGTQFFTINPNQYIIIPASSNNLVYGTDEGEPWTIYWVHFTASKLAVFNNALDIHIENGPQTIHFNQKGLEIWEEMYDSLEKGLDLKNLRKANFCLYHFLATFLYAEERKPEAVIEDQVTTTIHYMRQMVHEKLSVEEMAGRLKLSTSYFSNLFRKATGMPPFDYFTHLKIQKACQLLYTGNMKVKEIADSIGYEDPFHFSRLFKKHMKVSPLRYRELRNRSILINY